MTISAPALSTRQAALPVLIALSVTHLLNDMIQSLIPAIYPIIKDAYHLDFVQVGLITLTFQISASLLQPVVGMYTDRHPMPYRSEEHTSELQSLMRISYAVFGLKKNTT